jgi:hypothetical protein
MISLHGSHHHFMTSLRCIFYALTCWCGRATSSIVSHRIAKNTVLLRRQIDYRAGRCPLMKTARCLPSSCSLSAFSRYGHSSLDGSHFVDRSFNSSTSYTTQYNRLAFSALTADIMLTLPHTHRLDNKYKQNHHSSILKALQYRNIIKC